MEQVSTLTDGVNATLTSGSWMTAEGQASVISGMRAGQQLQAEFGGYVPPPGVEEAHQRMADALAALLRAATDTAREPSASLQRRKAEGAGCDGGGRKRTATMLDDRNASPQRPQRWHDGNMWSSLRTLASVLTVIWAGFCAIVIAVDVLDPEASAGLSPVERAAMIGISVFVLSALAAIPRRWEMAGGVLLVIAGLLPWLASLAGLGARPWDLSLGTLLIAGFFLGILPIVAGGLFLLDARTRRWNGPA